MNNRGNNTRERASLRDALFGVLHRSGGAVSGEPRKGALTVSSILDKAILLLLLGAICLFVLWPVACILLRSLGDGEGGFTLAAYAEVWSRYRENLWNSVFVGVLSALACTVFSTATAIFIATRRGWVKMACMALLLITMVSPPFVSSLAYIQLYGRRGWITYRLLGISWDPYNCWGVIWMQSISFVPLNALLLIGILSKLDTGSLQAARDLGAKPAAILRDVVLPLMGPGILVSLLLSFVRSLSDYGTPVIIGGRFSTIASEIYLQLVGYSDLEKSSAMNMFLLLPAIAAFFLYRYLMRRSDKLSEGSRARQGRLELSLSRCGLAGVAIAAVSILFFLMMVLQYGCIFLAGFLKSTKGVYSFTLRNWEELWAPRHHYHGPKRSLCSHRVPGGDALRYALCLLHGTAAGAGPELF